jgi:hypothetical protein
MRAAGKFATGKRVGLLLASRADARQLASVRMRVERSQLLFDAPPTVWRLGGAQVALEGEFVQKVELARRADRILKLARGNHGRHSERHSEALRSTQGHSAHLQVA